MGGPLTFLFTGFAWLVCSSLLGMAILLGLIHGTPLPRWLGIVHAHGTLIGGLLQIAVGGLLASMLHASDHKRRELQSRPWLFVSLNVVTAWLLVALGARHTVSAGAAGLMLFAIVASLTGHVRDHAQEDLAAPHTPSWIFVVALWSLLAGLLLGAGMVFQLAPEYFGHVRLLHLHLIVLGCFTLLSVAVTHRLLPAALQQNLASPKVGRTVLLLLPAGFAALAAGFTTSSLRIELVVGIVLLLMAGAYAMNLARTLARSGGTGNLASDHFLIAALFLVLVTGTGILMGLNFLSQPPVFPIGSLHLAAYTHMAFLGFLMNTVCGALSYGLPVYLAASRVPSRKTREPYLSRLAAIMNRLRIVQLVSFSFGPMALVLVAALTWNAPMSAVSVRVSAWVATGLLLTGVTLISAKLAWVASLRPSDSPPSS